MMFQHDNTDLNHLTVQGAGEDDIVSNVFVSPVLQDANGTCLAALCEHVAAWNWTCGEQGFARDLEHIATSHDIEGNSFNAFSAPRGESMYHGVSKAIVASGEEVIILLFSLIL